MEEDIKLLQSKLDEQKNILDALLVSSEKMRKYFLITAWVTVIAIVIPMVGLLFIGPSFVGSYSEQLQSNQ